MCKVIRYNMTNSIKVISLIGKSGFTIWYWFSKSSRRLHKSMSDRWGFVEPQQTCWRCTRQEFGCALERGRRHVGNSLTLSKQSVQHGLSTRGNMAADPITQPPTHCQNHTQLHLEAPPPGTGVIYNTCKLDYWAPTNATPWLLRGLSWWTMMWSATAFHCSCTPCSLLHCGTYGCIIWHHQQPDYMIYSVLTAMCLFSFLRITQELPWHLWFPGDGLGKLGFMVINKQSK